MNQYFDIQESIEKYGIKNLRVFMDGSPIDFGFFRYTGLPMGLTNSDNVVPMVEFNIDQCSYNHIFFIPSDKYKITVTEYGEEAGEVNKYNNEKKYIGDFNHLVKSGIVKIYVETADGYQLVFGKYENLLSVAQSKALEWSKNTLNILHLQSQN